VRPTRDETHWRDAPRAYRGLVLLFYLCFFLLSASGRLGSSDAGAQLQASMLLATTGQLAAQAPRPTLASGWIRSANGRYYEPHDIGNVMLMLPAAWIGQHLASPLPAADFDRPPLVCRLGVSLTYAAISALGCFFMFRLFALQFAPRAAFLLSLLLPATTIFWAYSKTAWDVMGAGCGMCALLYAAALVLRGRNRPHHLIGLGAACAIVCAFRYSVTPFLALGVAGVLYGARRDLTWRGYITSALAMLAGLLPSFVYNSMRTGSALRPATATAEYLRANNAIGGDVLSGLWGVLASPNHGLLVFSPIFLLLFIVPFVWSRIDPHDRPLCGAMGAAALTYLVFIASLKWWGGTFGWGPRFLVPIVPILFYGAALALTAIWDRWRRPLLGLIVISVLVSAPPVLVNWSSAIMAFPGALDQEARWPYQHVAVWQELVWGLQGKPLPVPAALAADPERRAGARFPDLWIVRLMERSPGQRVAGWAILLTLGLVGACTTRTLLSPSRVEPRGEPPTRRCVAT
jgi:hypothetical protein